VTNPRTFVRRLCLGWVFGRPRLLLTHPDTTATTTRQTTTNGNVVNHYTSEY